ncbi:NAD(P)-binding protein [Agrocybe pediades]|nr:NAD(P)-binding protein [Agrocybe pediades]
MVWPFSSPERTSVSEDELLDLRGKVAIVTGGNSGIGYATVRVLARRGAKVYLAARSEERARAALAQLAEEQRNSKTDSTVPYGHVEWLKLDLSDIRQTKAAAEEVIRKEKRLDILVNNAAIGNVPYTYTADGLLEIMVVNHISPFLFTLTLLPLLQQTAASNPTADVRIVNLSSDAHTFAPHVSTFIGDEALNKHYEDTWLGHFRTYGYTKLANILFTSELSRRLSSSSSSSPNNSNITTLSVHPGNVSTPGSQQVTNTVPYLSWLTSRLSAWIGAKPKEGAYTSLFAAAHPEVKQKREKYDGVYLVPVGKIGKISENARDERLARELWETTERKMKELGVL